GFLVSCNRSALALTGFERTEDVAGTHFSKSVFAAERDRAREGFAVALQGRTDHFSSLLLMREGGPIPVEIAMFAARAGAEIGGVFVQVREQFSVEAAEMSLTVSQQRFRSLFEYHPDPIISLKHDGTISRVNVALEMKTGFLGEDLIGKPWLDVIDSASRTAAQQAFATAATGEARELEVRLLARSGATMEVSLKLVPLRVANDVEGAYAIARDLTAQRAAEREIATQAERVRELYAAASARGKSVESQIDNTLALGCRMFGFNFGYVTRFQDDKIAILNAVGQGSPVPRGSVWPMNDSLSRHLLGRNSVFVPDMEEEPWLSDSAYGTSPWRSYYGIKLVVNEKDFGAMVFASRQPRAALEARDRDLLHMMALFVAAALERVRYTESMEQLAFYDSLTGLPNRVLFDDRMRQTVGAAKRYGRDFSVMYLDLDDFKAINDQFGHPEGDRVLREVSQRLMSALRESDTLARFGGDEFVVLQPVVNAQTDAEDLARKLVRALHEPIETGMHRHHVRTSVGIALYPRDGTSSNELLECADRALYRAKRAGRDTYQFNRP
ncbi:MAG TPA: diguanylate cyclase, partial [Candidatus Baltobacteraceae bacterium]|nr:diguanylate cyclase [Candidatus Baltobacteraceae bacterium]